ncbi:DUF4156 domain-containing protein [Alteromonas oceanisediminis]|uniref:DUF4156 domain-containing protein n=1 Tax=Alteromonas oceanisediminis TaxID=2836180 RepID=UPI001BDA1522|nr:DUF4156 domain-containing protein [Alteromonas oceanisediminis]MBT0586132.1 DUF4156 domain-containing protein [Alteromonas oceanisediminis]
MKIYLTVFLVAGLSACSSMPLDPNAKLVRLTNNEPTNECVFLGDVTGNQGDFFTGEFTSNADLETGARNDIKNKAYNMGGNVVYLLTERAGQSGAYDPKYGGGTSQTNVTLSGNVYRCP